MARQWILVGLVFMGLQAHAGALPPLLLSDSIPARKGSWEILFDGKHPNPWRSKNGQDFPEGGWAIENGTLFLARKGAGDIVTRETFGNFELTLDFKLTKGANSGVKYFVGTLKDTQTGKTVVNGPEYQIIDDYNHPAVKHHAHDIASTGSCYLLYAPVHKKLLRAGKWNHMKIIARGTHVEHWLNGRKVLSYERGSSEFEARKATTKFKSLEGYGTLPEGHILLTDHGDRVYFRRVKIRRL